MGIEAADSVMYEDIGALLQATRKVTRLHGVNFELLKYGQLMLKLILLHHEYVLAQSCNYQFIACCNVKLLFNRANSLVQ